MRARLDRLVRGSVALAFIAVVATSALPARADAPAGRYTVTGGIVTDTKTALRWQQTTGTFDKAGPTAYCAGLDLGGGGWRLPTMKELQTLVDESRTNPAIDPIFAMAAGAYLFPSSSPYVGLTNAMWAVSFRDGSAMYYGSATGGVVRCVR